MAGQIGFAAKKVMISSRPAMSYGIRRLEYGINELVRLG